MNSKGRLLIGAGALAIATGVVAGPTASVVSLRYTVQENDPEKLQRIVTTPVERVMQKLERVATLNSTTSHGTVDVEIGFEGETTMQDLATVTKRMETVKFDDEVVITSCTVELRAPRLVFEGDRGW